MSILKLIFSVLVKIFGGWLFKKQAEAQAQVDAKQTGHIEGATGAIVDRAKRDEAEITYQQPPKDTVGALNEAFKGEDLSR